MRRIRSAKKVAKKINKKFKQDEMDLWYAEMTYNLLSDTKYAIHFECNDGNWKAVKGE